MCVAFYRITPQNSVLKRKTSSGYVPDHTTHNLRSIWSRHAPDPTLDYINNLFNDGFMAIIEKDTTTLQMVYADVAQISTWLLGANNESTQFNLRQKINLKPFQVFLGPLP